MLQRRSYYIEEGLFIRGQCIRERAYQGGWFTREADLLQNGLVSDGPYKRGLHRKEIN